VVVHVHHRRYKGSLTIGAHTPPASVILGDFRTRASSAGFTVHVVLAQDIDGQWWDAMAGERLDAAWKSVEDPDCRAWVDLHVPQWFWIPVGFIAVRTRWRYCPPYGAAPRTGNVEGNHPQGASERFSTEHGP
jgi:hypothetical protein